MVTRGHSLCRLFLPDSRLKRAYEPLVSVREFFALTELSYHRRGDRYDAAKQPEAQQSGSGVHLGLSKSSPRRIPEAPITWWRRGRIELPVQSSSTRDLYER